MNIDEIFKAFKRQYLKICCKLKLDIAKILKLDEMNQYGFAMAKTMPIRSIKK